MKFDSKLLPYYLGRALVSALFGWLMSLNMGAGPGAVMGLVFFIGFLYYLHSGRFVVDETHPFFPLRRDERAEHIRNRALVIAAVVLGIGYAGLFILQAAGLSTNSLKGIVFALAAAAYFIFSIVLERVD